MSVKVEELPYNTELWCSKTMNGCFKSNIVQCSASMDNVYVQRRETTTNYTQPIRQRHVHAYVTIKEAPKKHNDVAVASSELQQK